MNVAIYRIYSDKIFYSVGNVKESISARKVKSFQQGYYDSPGQISKVKGESNRPILFFSGNYAYSYRLAKIPSNYPSFVAEYIRKLKSGTSWGLDIGFFVNEQTALGFTYNRYNSSMTYNNVMYTFLDPDTSIVGKMSDNITIEYYAPTIFFNFTNFEESIRFSLSASIGIVKFENNAEAPILDAINNKVEIGHMELKGESIGLGLGASVNFKLDKNIYIGPKVDIFTGVIQSLSYKDKYRKETLHAEGEGESMVRISAGGALRFYF